MKYIITENQLNKIIENDEKQSFFDKLKQKVSLFNPVKLTEEMKLKMLEFVIQSIKNDDCNYSMDKPFENSLHIYPRKKILINGIKSRIYCQVVNLKQTLEKKSGSKIYLEFMDAHEKSGTQSLGFLDKDNEQLKEFISLLTLVAMAESSKKGNVAKFKNFAEIKKQNKKESKPKVKDDDRYGDDYSDDYDDDEYGSRKNGGINIPFGHRDDNGGFGGFGGGKSGGGGAGGNW